MASLINSGFRYCCVPQERSCSRSDVLVRCSSADALSSTNRFAYKPIDSLLASPRPCPRLFPFRNVYTLSPKLRRVPASETTAFSRSHYNSNSLGSSKGFLLAPPATEPRRCSTRRARPCASSKRWGKPVAF